MTLSVMVENSMTLYASPTRPEWPERAAAYCIQIAGEFQCSLIETIRAEHIVFQGKVDKLIVGEHSELPNVADAEVHFRKAQASEEGTEAVFPAAQHRGNAGAAVIIVNGARPTDGGRNVGRPGHRGNEQLGGAEVFIINDVRFFGIERTLSPERAGVEIGEASQPFRGELGKIRGIPALLPMVLKERHGVFGEKLFGRADAVGVGVKKFIKATIGVNRPEPQLGECCNQMTP